jgi:hypothetical protein
MTPISDPMSVYVNLNQSFTIARLEDCGHTVCACVDFQGSNANFSWPTAIGLLGCSTVNIPACSCKYTTPAFYPISVTNTAVNTSILTFDTVPLDVYNVSISSVPSRSSHIPLTFQMEVLIAPSLSVIGPTVLHIGWNESVEIALTGQLTSTRCVCAIANGTGGNNVWLPFGCTFNSTSCNTSTTHSPILSFQWLSPHRHC